MAPNRRKGAGKAAAAACLQWKVDDLVLAKVKGFPAWPAVVSEAGKWGLPVDRKKVFVYFFGTQQIAFCNPADVEAFTEEKKVNLLGKRHGKGADFVRAVREIVDSFEKLKSKDQGDNVPSTDEVTMTNGNNSVESLADSDVKDEAPKAINGTYPESSDSTKAKCDDDFPVRENLAATTQVPSHDREEAPLENSMVNTNVEEAPQPTTYSRKKYGATQAQNFVTHKIVPSARRSRNSSRVDSRKLQSFVMLPSRNIRKSSGNVSRYGLRDASSRRSKRVRKSPDVSEVNDVDSPAFVSSGSHEENGSGTDTDDSDSISYNDGSTVESGYGLAQTASAVELSEGDAELNQRLDFQSSSIIVKKKRKPSRKRSHSGANEFTGRLEKERESEIEEHKSGQSLPNDIKDAKENYINEDGDEHLPLLKRARVRMGRPSSEVVEPESSAQPEEKSSEVSDRVVRLNVNSGEDSPVDRLSSVNDTESMVNKFPVNKPPLWEVKKQFGCSIDGEADLPPSKRIHRALEAMSANVAEDIEATFEEPSTKTSMSASCFFAGDSSNVSQNNKLEGKTILHNLDLACKNSAQDAISGCSTDSAPLIINEGPSSNIKVAAPLVINDSPKPTSCGDGVAAQAVDCSDCKSPGIFSLIKPESETEVLPERTKSLSPAVDRKVNTHKGSEEDVLQPSTDNHQIENPDLEQPVDPSRISRKNLDTVSANIEILNGSTQDDACLSPCNLQANFETSNMLKLDMDKGENKDNGMFMVKGEPTVKDSKAFFSPTRDARSSLQGPQLFQSDSHSEDHLNHKAVSGICLSSSPTLVLGSTARAPPHNNSSCSISGSDDSVPFANNSCCNRDIPLTHEKPKSSGKQNGKVEAGAALASFENLLGLLTRTKDSIGRATRSAIECAKHGLASKVVEVLARNLEREPNLHKRVDLFFLVDSITQCSRGLKGEVGGVYPSAIQSVLPRLLLAAAPPGSNGRENRRQCLKVLRLWQDRRVLPESVIRRHIRDLDSASNPVSAGPFCRRLQRTERAFDDPLREVEGMVDEYGSNSSFQLPGFRMPPMLKDEDDGRDSDGEGFEAVTPEHCSDNPGARPRIDANEKRSHILEAVDGELEMEDVSPSCEAELSSTSNGRVRSAEVLHHRFEQGFPVISGPPLPKDVPPSSPPLPKSPPPPPHQSLPLAPPPPPPPALPLAPQPPLSALPELVTNVLDSKFYKKEDKQQFIAQHPVATRIDPITADAAPYRVPENRDLRMSTQVPESVNSGSYSSLPASHPPVQQLNNVPQVDGAISQNKTLHMRSQVPESVNSCSFGAPVSRPPIRHGNSVPQVDGAISQNKAFHLRPPHPAPSNQFSYVQATDHRTQTREIPPQSYPDRFHYVQNRDRGNVYSDHDRFESASHDTGDNWRHPERPFSGPSYHDRGRLPYAPGPYGCPPREAPIQDRGWAYPPRGMNHREFMSHRRPLDGPIPVASRGPNYWRPR